MALHPPGEPSFSAVNFAPVYASTTSLPFSAKIFGTLFNVKAVTANLFLHGAQRPTDETLIRIIEKQLTQKERISVLEVGAGQTYGGIDPNYGSPWLSRALAATYGDQIEVLASDFRGDLVQQHRQRRVSFSIMYVEPGEPEAYYYANTLEETNEHAHAVPLSAVNAETGKLTPVPVMELRAAPRIVGSIESLAQHSKQFGHPINEKGQFYVRPLFDRQVEELVFGLEIACAVDRDDLADSFPDRKFDIVFSRFHSPLGLNEEAFMESAQRVLSDTGEVLLAIENRVL